MWHETLAPWSEPYVLPIVEQTHQDDGEKPSMAALFVLALAQRLQNARSMSIEEPVSLRTLPTRLDHLLQQGVRQLLVLPWCLQEQTTELLEVTTDVVQSRVQSYLSTTIIPRPIVPVPGALPAGPFGGFLSVQDRLDRYVAQLPGWQTRYLHLETETTTLLIPNAPLHLSQCKHVRDIASLEMALFCTLCPDHRMCHTFHVDEALLRDATIYAAYLTQLLLRAMERAFPPVLLCAEHAH